MADIDRRHFFPEPLRNSPCLPELVSERAVYFQHPGKINNHMVDIAQGY